METPEWQQYVALEARLLVGILFLLAGAAKLADATDAKHAIRDYVPVPDIVLPSLARALPIIEVVLGVCLLLGLLRQTPAIVAIGLLTIFSAGGMLNLLRGRKMECHCLGGVLRERLGWSVIVRNVVLIGLMCVMLGTKSDLFAIGTVIARGPSAMQGWPPLLDLSPALLLAVLFTLAYLLAIRAIGLEAPASSVAASENGRVDGAGT